MLRTLKTLFVVLFLTLSIVLAKAQSNSPVVETNKGYIRGLVENNSLVFKGVPYAAAPIGRLRFMPPVAHAAWADTLAATKFGNIAKQVSGGKVTGSEDCLSLNIYAPMANTHKRAVLVWVHGGSMTNGAGRYNDGHAFADNDDIVTVTINYRLGAFGFMYLGDIDKRYAQSGNNGLLDVVAALAWIKQNIAAFGGDPNRVTLMGESAGAKLISAVLVSAKSKGLFQQYIAESGSVQCIRDSVTAKNERGLLLRQMGLNQNDAGKLLTLPADSIIKIQGAVCTGIGGNSFFGPVYDGEVIKEDGYQYAAGKNMPPIKALIGTNEYESALFIQPDADFKNFNANTLQPLFGNDAPVVYTAYVNALKNNASYDAAVKTLTQYMYQMHSYRFAKVLIQNNIPVWVYRFRFDNGKKFGAAHAQELQYVWAEHNVLTDTDTVKKRLAQNIHNAWVAFIKTGDPNIPLAPQWPNYKNNTKQVMFFDTTDKVEGLTGVFDDKSFPSAVFVLR